jgi:hypothetical protein
MSGPVAVVEVDWTIAKTGFVEEAETESIAYGDVVPMPKFPPEKRPTSELFWTKVSG